MDIRVNAIIEFYYTWFLYIFNSCDLIGAHVAIILCLVYSINDLVKINSKTNELGKINNKIHDLDKMNNKTNNLVKI